MELLRKTFGPGDEHWVDFIHPDSVTSAQFRRYEAAVNNAAANNVSIRLATRDVMISVFVKAWSFPEKVPRSQLEIEKLAIPRQAYRQLGDVLDSYLREIDGVDEDSDETPPTPSGS